MHSVVISIHALREEGDKKDQKVFTQTAKFLSTPSARRATRYDQTYQQGIENFYPRPPRGGRQERPESLYTDGKISIHALREEGDWEG